jgi:hypothetical protein
LLLMPPFPLLLTRCRCTLSTLLRCGQ